MNVSIVVAIAENNAIGRHGDLLWKLPNDMKRFKEVTMGHHVFMGRKTYESIPEKFRPLAGRTNIILSRNTNIDERCKTVSSIEEAIAYARQNKENELMIIGGGELYKQAFPYADKIYLTIVHESFEDADTFFPEIVGAEWLKEKEQHFPADEKHAYSYTFVDLCRRNFEE